MANPLNEATTVFSSEQGKIKPKTNQERHLSQKFPDDGFIRIEKSSKGRGGKTVTCIYGLPKASCTPEFLKKLKQHCGSGGTIKDDHLEIQGNQLDKVESFLTQKSYKVKRVGG